MRLKEDVDFRRGLLDRLLDGDWDAFHQLVQLQLLFFTYTNVPENRRGLAISPIFLCFS